MNENTSFDLVMYFCSAQGRLPWIHIFLHNRSLTACNVSGSSWSPSFSTQALPGFLMPFVFLLGADVGFARIKHRCSCFDLLVFLLRYEFRGFRGFRASVWQVRIRAAFHPLMLVDLVLLGQLSCFKHLQTCPKLDAKHEMNEWEATLPVSLLKETWKRIKRYQLKETSLSSISKQRLPSLSLSFRSFCCASKEPHLPGGRFLFANFKQSGDVKMTKTCRTFQFNFSDVSDVMLRVTFCDVFLWGFDDRQQPAPWPWFLDKRKLVGRVSLQF